MKVEHARNGRSARLSYEGNTIVEAHEQIRMRRDYIIVEPLPVEHSSLLEVVEHVKPLRGLVKAVGPGVYPKRYDHPDKSRRTKMWDSPCFRQTEVRVGDVVELGGYEFGGYTFQQFLWGATVHIIVREEDVSGIVCDALLARAIEDQCDMPREAA